MTPVRKKVLKALCELSAGIYPVTAVQVGQRCGVNNAYRHLTFLEGEGFATSKRLPSTSNNVLSWFSTKRGNSEAWR